ncbi:MAG: extracellular solute-binding protein [Cyanobacteria bacterium P01_F01_bin.143]
MITRRQFLVTSTAVIASQLLSSCSNPTETLNVIMLQNSIPTQLVGAFRKTLANNAPIKFKPESQLRRIFNFLKTWKNPKKPENWGLEQVKKLWNRSPKQADLVTLGNSWLKNAIAENLIQPLDISKLAGWANLNPRFQQLVTQDGKIYAAPYRWGNTVIAYRKDKFEEFNQGKSEKLVINDWSDLWRPELAGKISLLDNYREIIGLTLKKLGYSYNSSDLAAIPNLESELQALQQQVKFYSSTKYLQPLSLGDTWVAVGWSTDILPLVRRNPDKIDVVVPASGTALWADLWVQPNIANGINDSVENRLESWIDFCWQDSGASTIMLFTNGISPVLNQGNQEQLTKDLKNNQDFIQSSLASFPKSDFIAPLAEETDQEYQALWKKIRTEKV